jgi:PTH1 family peptidyl-tRNA hydrolase
MWLLAGLGNPGPKYSRNRHNVGFMAVDAIHAAYAFPAWRHKFHGEISEATIPGIDDKIILLKPQTYMNKSGSSVRDVAQFYKIPLNQVVAFHDELDLAPGKMKVKQGGGSAGHNGLASLDTALGADYIRVRLGIGHPGVHEANKAELVLSYVLADFSRDDESWLDKLLEVQAKALPLLLKTGAGDYLNAIAKETKTSDTKTSKEPG